uniref:Uncharacterized protein n=1 Tax=Tetranychus urticae TaxID=32264 RepID=T1K1W1_TETUR
MEYKILGMCFSRFRTSVKTVPDQMTFIAKDKS